MFTDRDLLALSIIGVRNCGVDVSCVETVLDRMDVSQTDKSKRSNPIGDDEPHYLSELG